MKNLYFLIILALVLLVVSNIIGCMSPVVKNENLDSSQNDRPYTQTIHEYILYEYI